MIDKHGVSRGRQNRYPLGLDQRDPEGMADFLLGLGYDAEDVRGTLSERCGVDRLTAGRIVKTVSSSQQGGHS